MKAEDRVRLQHMLDAARDALSFAEGRTRADLDTDRKLVLALVKCVEIVGEAASQVSPETQAATPEFPWTQMTAMRHRLVHAYYDVDLDVVWSTLQEDLPQLVRALGTSLEAS
jgi:uncharacterized protein with HEPN domain